MKTFSEKALEHLTNYYVYALIDPRTDKIFYIGKGTGNRVFQHEMESEKSPSSEKEKLKILQDIKNDGLEVKRIIINNGLTENEAFAAEASLINLLNFSNNTQLSNIVSGHHFHECISTEDFEKIHGAKPLQKTDIKHNVLVIKINKLYKKEMSKQELYDTVRGVWRASLNTIQKKKIEYVFGVYNQLIVAVYKPKEWHYVYEKREDVPRPYEFEKGIPQNKKNRIYFVSESIDLLDENQKFYLNKSIADLKLNQSAQNPITYLFVENL